jgi:hypothetical protein
MFFMCGTDYFGDLKGVFPASYYDVHRPGEPRSRRREAEEGREIDAVIEDAWRRLGAMYLAGPDWAQESKTKKQPWAQKTFGDPDTISEEGATEDGSDE